MYSTGHYSCAFFASLDKLSIDAKTVNILIVFVLYLVWHARAIKSLVTPCVHHINQVCSSWHGSRHTHTYINRTTNVPLTDEGLGLISNTSQKSAIAHNNR